MKYIKLIVSGLLAAAVLVSCAGDGGDAAESGTGTETGTETAADTEVEFDYSEGFDDNGKLVGVDPAELVTLCKYTGISIPKEEYAATDEEIDIQFDTLVASFAETTEVKDRAVKDGDTVNIDYVGSVDGVEFEGGSTEGLGTEVTIGETNYIDDFLEQLIGHMPGETFNVEVTFPDPYPSDTTLSGKDAVFVTTINYIAEKTNPELTEAFLAEKYPEEGWKNEDDVRAGLAKAIEDDKIQSYINNYLLENCTVTVPESMFEYQENALISYYSGVAAQYNMTLDDYIAAGGFGTRTAFITYFAQYLENGAKNILISQMIAEKEGITVSDDDVIDYLKETVNGYNDSTLSTYESSMGMPYLKQATIQYKVEKLLRDSAKLGK